MRNDPDAGRSRYHIEQTGSGYRVSSNERSPVTIARERFCFRVVYEVQSEGKQAQVDVHLGLLEFRRLCRAVASGLMAAWEPRPHQPIWPGIQRWAVRRTEWSITGRLHACWKDLLAGADARVLEAQRALFATTFSAPALAFEPEFYRDPWLLSDVCRFRAAAWAAGHVPELGAVLLRRQNGSMQTAKELLNDPFAGDLLSPTEDVARCISLLHDWPALFSEDTRPYRSLRRTLAGLPGGIRGNLLRYLSLVRLPRPITDRVELAFVLAWVEATSTWAYAPAESTHTVFHARTPDIVRAMQRVAAHLRTDWSPRRCKDIGALSVFLADYPDVHRGNVVGLADKAIDWHRDLDREARAVAFEGLEAETETARPPIPLPEQPGVIFLDSVASIIAEGERMRHCIGQYAEGAVAGQCYLFHVEHAGETASVHVSPAGRVEQAYGPSNRRNSASLCGARALARWGTGLCRRAS